MKAFALTAPDQPASLVDLPDPEPGDDRIVVRVLAAGINGFDYGHAAGRFTTMLSHDLPTVVGRDFAGIVESVGSEWSGVEVGDEILGFAPSLPPLKVGTFAERVGGSGLVIAGKPPELSFIQAAAIPLAGATALIAVDAIAIEPDDVVVVAGATGGVGSFAIQIAAQRGARVVATARPGEEAAFVRGLGAAEVIDYQATNVPEAIRARHPGGIDALIDLVSRGDAFSAMADVVRTGGHIATTLGAADMDALAARGVVATNIRGMPTPENLAWLADEVAAGRLHVEIQETFPLASVQAALQAFGAGSRGKIVLEI